MWGFRRVMNQVEAERTKKPRDIRNFNDYLGCTHPPDQLQTEQAFGKAFLPHLSWGLRCPPPTKHTPSFPPHSLLSCPEPLLECVFIKGRSPSHLYFGDSENKQQWDTAADHQNRVLEALTTCLPTAVDVLMHDQFKAEY